MIYVPAPMSVLFVIGNPMAVAPLHCTTVAFSLVTAMNVRVEVISATLAPVTVVGLVMLVSVATKFKSVHCTVRISLQSNLLPVGVVVVKRIGSLTRMNGSTIQSRTIPCLTVQV